MSRFIPFAALTAFSLLAAAPAGAALTGPERTLVATVDAEQARTLSMLETWVNQNSGSQNVDGVTKVGAMLRAELEPLGFTVDWIDMRSTGRAGHLDTVFEPDSPFQRFTRNGDRATGPGVEDDKGGVAVMVAALRAMRAAGTLKDADITVFLTGDEEDSGNPIEVARRDLIAAGKAADVALDFEGLSQEEGPNGLLDMGSVARRSSGSWTLTVQSKPAHSSGIFQEGVGFGAAYELARILDEFRRTLREDKLSYNVGLIGSGQTATLDEGKIRLEAAGKTNIVPAVAIARGDLRALTQDQIDRTQAKMRAIVARPLPGTTASITFDTDGYPPMAPTEGNNSLLTRLNAVNRDMGLPAMGALDPVKRGAGDISFVAADVDGLVGLGAASEGAHTDRETIDIPSIWRQAKRAAILMSRLAAEKRSAR